MALRSIDTLQFEDVLESRAANNPWELPPNLTMRATLREILKHDFASILVAHLRMIFPSVDLDLEVRYQPAYKDNRARQFKVMDLEHRGVLYRHYNDKIYTKRVGN